MKNILTCIIFFTILPLMQPGKYLSATQPVKLKEQLPIQPASNLFIITIDGFRWQEIFTGADASLINDTIYSRDTATIKMLYWADSENERRQKLMPFFWNILAKKSFAFPALAHNKTSWHHPAMEYEFSKSKGVC